MYLKTFFMSKMNFRLFILKDTLNFRLHTSISFRIAKSEKKNFKSKR